MKPKSKQIPFASALVVFAFAGAWGVIRLFADEASLVIRNESGEKLRDVHVVVWSYQFYLGDIAPGDTKEIRIREYSDSSWAVEGFWSTGGHFSHQHGYITHGMSSRDWLIFAPNKTIRFNPEKMSLSSSCL